MRVVLLVLALFVAGIAAEQCGLGDKNCVPFPGLSAEQRESYFGTNMHHIEKLDAWSHKIIVDFLRDLTLNDVTIRLGNPIVGGHSIMYEFVEGPNPLKVRSVAQKHKLQIVPTRMCKCQNCCGRIILPGQPGKSVDIVEAVEVPSQRQLRANMPKNGGPPVADKPQKEKLRHLKDAKNPHDITQQEREDQERTRFFKLTPDQKQWYYDNNVAMITKMHPEAQQFVKKFLDDLRRNSPNTIVHFDNPILNGHSIRFTMVEGDMAPVFKYAAQCGMQLKGRTLTTPGGKAKTAEGNMDADEKGHIITEHPDQTPAGYTDPLKWNPAPATQRSINPNLPQPWIEVKPDGSPRFQEVPKNADDDDDSMTSGAGIAEPKEADDDDDALSAPKNNAAPTANTQAPKAEDDDAFLQFDPQPAPVPTAKNADDDDDALAAQSNPAVPPTNDAELSSNQPQQAAAAEPINANTKPQSLRADDDDDAFLAEPIAQDPYGVSPDQVPQDLQEQAPLPKEEEQQQPRHQHHERQEKDASDDDDSFLLIADQMFL